MLDLLIIGAGLAGLAAAYRAVQAGLTVRIIAKGQGATHWHAGTVDVLGYSLQDGQPVDSALEYVARFAHRHRDHPYAQIGVQTVQSTLADFAELTGRIGLPYEGAAVAGQNLLLPSPLGSIRPVYLAPAAQAAGRLDDDRPMVIVGFEGLRDFYPTLIAENLQLQGFNARPLLLPLSLITRRRDFNNRVLAESMESAEAVRQVGNALARLARPGERIGLPAILGYRQHPLVIEQLQQISGAALFEIPTLPPSVPGIRLADALVRHLATLGVRVEIGMSVVDFRAEDGQIAWVATETSARPLKHRARHFLLATGGILGGGIDSDHTGQVWENVFDLPLDLPPQRTEWFHPQFLDPAGQPIFRSGVRVNSQLQPIDARNNVVFGNLWAAGGILAGADGIRERSLEGIAISTGMAAAQEIAKRSSAAPSAVLHSRHPN